MRAILPALAFLTIAGTGPGQAAIATPLISRVASPGLLCRTAISAAEQGQAIPAHLLAAIGRVESGRRDEATGGMHPWPWTINAEGQGSFFESKAQAIAAVRALQARGVRSIDVGCMQINLMHHPDAFASLDQAFDPTANAAYGARFLRQLYVQSGSWQTAIGLYHSATPERAEPYRQQVLAAWPEETGQPTKLPLLAMAPGLLAGPSGLPPVRRAVGMQSAPTVPPPAQVSHEPRGLASYRSTPLIRTTNLLRMIRHW